MARAIAASLLPVNIPIETARTLEVQTSGGTAFPIIIEPINIASRDAPRINPVFKSPRTNPTNVPRTRGRPIIVAPKSCSSTEPIPAIRASSIHFNNIVFPPICSFKIKRF